MTEDTEFFLSSERGLPKGLMKIVAHLQQAGVRGVQKEPQQISREFWVISRSVSHSWCQYRGEYALKALLGRSLSIIKKSITINAEQVVLAKTQPAFC